jgi:predicted Fe-Mo cluster-binding NifX family protein
MSYRIAIASSNGESVDQHFGQAQNFLIYQVSSKGIDFVEDREVQLVQSETPHSEENLERLVKLLEDCSAVFVLKIGARSSGYLQLHHISVFEVDFSLNHIFTTLIKQEQQGRVRILRENKQKQNHPD